MHIEHLWIDNLPPLQDFEVQFDRRLSIIRGNNGLGKTLVLEAMSLLGHVPILDFELWRQPHVPQVRMRLLLREVDLEFLDALWDEASDSPTALGRNCQQFQQKIPRYAGFWTDDSIRAARQAAHRVRPKAGSKSETASIEIGFHLKLNPEYNDAKRESYGFLKDCLSNEVREAVDPQIRRSALQHNWSVRCSSEDQYKLIALLHSVNRPTLADESQPDKWNRTLRTALLDNELPESTRALPGFVSYINTDMYEWGTGLDLRESPKQLREDLTRVIHRRLQLTRRGVDINGRPEFRLRSADDVFKQWKKLFNGSGTPDLTAVSHHPERPGEPWSVRIGGQTSDFASSGENQVFFLLSLTACLHPHGSCLLLDEPELHLSFAASRNLLEHLQHLARDNDCQILVVSHALFHADRYESELENIYLKRENTGKELRTVPYYGEDSMAHFALETHKDIKNALKPMMLPRSSVALDWWSLGTLLLPGDVRDGLARWWQRTGALVRRRKPPSRD